MFTFSESDRRIFEYFDGSTLDEAGKPVKLYGDPIDLHARINAILEGEANDVYDRAHAGDADAHANLTRLVDAIRETFGLAPFDRTTGQGATFAMCLKVWDAFASFLDEKKNPPACSPTSPQPTEAGCSPVPSITVP